MRRITLAVLVCGLVCSNPSLAAQEKQKTEEKSEAKRDMTPLRVQVVIAEYDGEKRLSSLPYTLLVNAENPRGQKAAIRMGLRVPVATSTNQFQYMDVGTNLDGWAGKAEDGRFVLHLGVERSSAYSSSSGQKAALVGGNEVLSTQPVIQSFRSELDVLIRDGQAIETTVATDPVSGRVTKVGVTVNILK
ncbi:MAG TPA: hypothetical protein VN943_09730 [Candidatus Acidoferrum sp.]|nr:hypothetical protein [Candidatus Acidoferrum sp.]